MKKLIILAPAVFLACAPATTASNKMPGSGSLPLAAGQTWLVSAKASIVTVKVSTVISPNPGIYVGADASGFSPSSPGMGAPTVSLDKNKGTMRFVWPEGVTINVCRITDFTIDPNLLKINPKAVSYAGDLLQKETVVGSCTVTKLEKP